MSYDYVILISVLRMCRVCSMCVTRVERCGVYIPWSLLIRSDLPVEHVEASNTPQIAHIAYYCSGWIIHMV